MNTILLLAAAALMMAACCNPTEDAPRLGQAACKSHSEDSETTCYDAVASFQVVE